VLSPDGSVVASQGAIDRPFYLRSAAKPFQAMVAQEAGAGLEPLELAMACASHRGYPAHIALVAAMLSVAGLGEGDLRCPADWPLGAEAARMVLRRGAVAPRRIWHNCSGKHAGFLRACAARGWPLANYRDSAHPLQQRIIEVIGELSGMSVEPVGVDGCGVPVLRTTARAMGLLYARLGNEPALADVFGVMRSYPSLIGVNGSGDSEISIATGAAAKGGAAGCIGVAVDARFGLAVKSWDGLGGVAAAAAVAALDQLGVLGETARTALAPVLRPTVLGGGLVVGHLEPSVELT